MKQAIQYRAQQKRATELSRTEGQTLLAQTGQDLQRQYGQDFAPLEQQLRATAFGANAGTVVQGTKDAVTQAGTDADISAAAYERERRALGVGAPSASQSRRLGLSRVLAQVDAGNRSSDSAVSRQKAAQQWGAQQWGASAADAVSTLSGIAQSEYDRYNQYRRAKADRKASIVGTISGIAGAAVGAFA